MAARVRPPFDGAFAPERFHAVYVTGPQRSGTTICARMIAHDTGRLFVDESEFSAHDRQRMEEIVRQSERPVVVQCPALSRWAHEFGGGPDAAVVFMRRAIPMIRNSEHRIRWREEEREKKKYDDCEIRMTRDAHIAQVKMDYWMLHQEHEIASAYEVIYEALCEHPLWIPANERRDFGPRQWRLKEAA